MILISLKNVEDLIFKNKRVRDQLPEYDDLFKLWDLAVRQSAMKSLGQNAVIQLLNRINPAEMSLILGEEVGIQRMNANIIKNISSSIDEIEKDLNSTSGFDNIMLYREGNNIYVSLWR